MQNDKKVNTLRYERKMEKKGHGIKRDWMGQIWEAEEMKAMRL